MTGRDPDQPHRAATPLELLFDLTFVIAFGVAADQLAHYLAEGHGVAGVIGFVYAVFSVVWAWINFSWFGGGDRRLVGISVVVAATGAALGWPLALLAMTPWVTVVGYETIGHRRGAQVVANTAPDGQADRRLCRSWACAMPDISAPSTAAASEIGRARPV